jgi:hypothetical protein
MSNWVMTIPVLSTNHIPGPEAMDLMLATQASACDDCGYLNFVHLDEIDKDVEDWLEMIADRIYNKYDTYWVRFDPDGDVIPDLPTYEDKWL